MSLLSLSRMEHSNTPILPVCLHSVYLVPRATRMLVPITNENEKNSRILSTTIGIVYGKRNPKLGVTGHGRGVTQSTGTRGDYWMRRSLKEHLYWQVSGQESEGTDRFLNTGGHHYCSHSSSFTRKTSEL